MAWNTVFEGVTIAASGTATSRVIGLQDGKDIHSFQYKVTGDGTVSITVYTSIDGTDFITNGVKANAITKTSGPGSDGKNILGLQLKPGDHIQFAATASGDTVVLTVWFTQK